MRTCVTRSQRSADPSPSPAREARRDAPIIELRNFAYTYLEGTPRANEAIRDVSLEIQRGERVAIVGPPHSGKSTIVDSFAHLLRLKGGQVFYEGEDVAAPGYDRRPLRREVGIVFQQPDSQIIEDVVGADVAFGPTAAASPAEETRRRVEESLDALGLPYPDYRLRYVHALSGGQRRRVAIAGVLAMHTPVLVLDEPMAGLDPRGRQGAARSSSSAADDRELTLDRVLRYLNDASLLCDRFIVLDRGRSPWTGACARSCARPTGSRISTSPSPSRSPARGRCRSSSPTSRPTAHRRRARVRAPKRLGDRVVLELQRNVIFGQFVDTGSLSTAWTPASRSRRRRDHRRLVPHRRLPRLRGRSRSSSPWASSPGSPWATCFGARSSSSASSLFILLFQVLFYAGDVPTSTCGGGAYSRSPRRASYTAILGLRVILLYYVTTMLMLTTSLVDLTNGLELIFGPLQRIGVPVNELVLVFVIAIKFVPIFIEEIERLARAQTARGVPFDEGGAISRARRIGRLLVPIFISGFARADP